MDKATHDAYIYGVHEIPSHITLSDKLTAIIQVGDVIVTNRRGRPSVQVMSKARFDQDYVWVLEKEDIA